MTSTSVFDQLPLDQIEEVAGELHRRAGSALRRIGEARADDPDPEGESPRHRIAALIATGELAIATFAAAGATAEAPRHRVDREPLAIGALMYGAPTLVGLLGRLEQNRRILASLARHLEPRLDEVVATAWGDRTLRQLLVLQAIEEPARCAQAFELHLAAIEADAGA
jgi:hypothetical protein